MVDGDGSSTHLERVLSKSLQVDIIAAPLKQMVVFFVGDMETRGQLGNNASGTTNNKDHPVPVLSVDGASNLGGITYIAAGSSFTCALSYTKNVYCWGQ